MFELRWVEYVHIIRNYGSDQSVGEIRKKLQYRFKQYSYDVKPAYSEATVEPLWSEWVDVPTVRDDLT